jgi:hypothetical protein
MRDDSALASSAMHHAHHREHGARGSPVNSGAAGAPSSHLGSSAAGAAGSPSSPDPSEIEDQLEWEEWNGEGLFAHHMLAGSLAGVAEHLCMYPVDTFKVRILAIRLRRPRPVLS